MSFIGRIGYLYMISQVVIYVVQALFFLVGPLNKPQKLFTQIFQKSTVINYVMIGYLLVEVVLAVMFFESLTQWKWDQQLISHHLDNTSFDVIEDKEDLYRHERNLYMYGTAFFVSLANIRYFTHLTYFYEQKDTLKTLLKP